MVNTKLLLPVALGVSLMTVSALLVYYFVRRDEDDDQPSRTQIKTMNTIEVSVPKNIMPALIGRGGSNVKELEKKTGASIKFKKFPERDADTCIIRGRTETTQLAETMIHEFIANQPLIEEDKLTVPGWACGRIIGSGGENINDICHRSGARVKVEGGPQSHATDRLVTFRGTKQQIQQAKELVEKCVAQQKCMREVDASKSPRHNAHSSVAAEPTDVPGDTNTIPKHVKRTPRAGVPTIEVYVSAVSSPSRFWVQFVGNQVQQLDDLVNHMTDYYKNPDNRELHKLSQVTVGQVVAAVFRHDGRWYRARVVDIRPNEFVPTQQVADCFFLDYGDSEYVPMNEMCELRADLLRLRFQAMECFLAGVRPAGSEAEVVGLTPTGQRWDKWNPKAIQRFEQLSEVAKWKILHSRTCTYKKSVYNSESEKDKEIPGIKLYDVTDEGEVDIGGLLIDEGWAVEVPLTPRASPRPTTSSPVLSSTPPTPFGDLGASRVLDLTDDRTSRGSSLPRNHQLTSTPGPASAVFTAPQPLVSHGNDRISSVKSNGTTPISASLSSGLERTDYLRPNSPLTTSHAKLSYPDPDSEPRPHLNGSHASFLNAEREPHNGSLEHLDPSPIHKADPREEFKANMNRIDSHHNLEALGNEHVN